MSNEPVLPVSSASYHGGQAPDDQGLALDVRFGDQVDGSFFTNRPKVSEVLLKNLAAVAGGGDPHAFD